MLKTKNIIWILAGILLWSGCSKKLNHEEASSKVKTEIDYITLLDSVWRTEQGPISKRDSLMRIYGAESEKVLEQQEIYEANHRVNEKIICDLLDENGWPNPELTGARGNWTICNVIQHADNEVRLKYLPMMRKAVNEQKLEPRFLARAEDRIATERGDLQLYGGQMKYYPETKSFNLWPVYDPENIDKRRAAIGLEPIDVFLKNRFDFEWDLEEQIQRSKEFERVRQSKIKN
ncbi:hypothetical protein LCM02_03070 [Lutimonas saemankumensis]|uniref:DUF6624 domain-containing protein n=1 Tax=Lutimonas saemankumensis TaxID=483016 RepID=UPI001CD7115A|nr:DUF6624 domain-containing protein [Lutimonas saemankumensis]MCA0931419.1 hypothetical protein [Lutimonas saemankumensis]